MNDPERLNPRFSTKENSGLRVYLYSIIAAEVSALTRYFDRLVQWRPRQEDRGLLFDAIDCSSKTVAHSVADLASDSEEPHSRTAILINGNFNHSHDIQGTLIELKRGARRGMRVVAIAYNPYLRWLYTLANFLGFRNGEVPETFMTYTDLDNLAKISGYEVVKIRPIGHCPLRLGGFGNFLNRMLPALPFVRWSALAAVVVMRPIVEEQIPPSLSIIIPARNERGNIENALKRIPELPSQIEVIFVEGHSTDGTWEEIQRVLPLYQGRLSIQAYKQTGKGKCDAVRLGFSKAEHDLVTILDADLTMPPELLPRFYEVYRSGLADFVNGNRLVYPMEGQAMRFLNRCGNIFFAKALSTVLGISIGDSLCGTKLMARHDYHRFCRWREDFGDFDPFGDFELIFPAAELGLGVVDVPVRYRDRVYGTTNISRFYHGWMLLKMTVIAFFRITLGKVSASSKR